MKMPAQNKHALKNLLSIKLMINKNYIHMGQQGMTTTKKK